MPILKPSPVDIVPAATVETIVAETQRELTARDEERAAAEAAADTAERAAAGGADDLAFHEWMTAHLDRFVTLLREEHDTEMRSMVDGAERRAQACIERAQVDADMLTSYAHALRGTAAPSGAPIGIGAGSEPAPDVEPVAPLAPLVWRPSETHIDVPATPPVPAVVVDAAPALVVPTAPPVVVPPAPAMTVPPAPAMTGAPAPVLAPPPAPVVAAVPVVPAVPVADAAGAPPPPPVVAQPTLAPEPPPPPPPAPPVADAPAPVPAVGEAKDQSRAAKLKEFVHGLPTFAILQVLAVVVVLIIVLIRIG